MSRVSSDTALNVIFIFVRLANFFGERGNVLSCFTIPAVFSSMVFVKEFSLFYVNLFDRNIFARSAATSLVLVWPILCFDVKISHVSILCNIRDV